MIEVEYRVYQRTFQPPLVTHHGVWRDRQGIIVRLTDSGHSGWGEIAPIHWLGSETLTEAIAFCQTLPSHITPEAVFSIPDHLPACQFGFESAWEMLQPVQDCQRSDPTEPLQRRSLKSLKYSRLLPTGAAALQAWQAFWQQGERTFKWKIGVNSLTQELALFEQLLQDLPIEANLRLDANGGLSENDAHQWLVMCQRYQQVEFLEQPLAVDQFEPMLQLSHQYTIPIALDESVTTLNQLEACYEQGWRGVFVVKAAIAGSPQRLRRFCQSSGADVVWSSTFETAIAQRFILNHLIPSISPISQAVLPQKPQSQKPQSQRAVGFGVNHWFLDDFNCSDSYDLWQRL